MQTDVLVVGAGPTGLMLGTELGLAGVVPVVIDALPTPSGQSKGIGMQPRTAEVFDLRGMTDQLLDRALPHESVGGHFGILPVELDCRPWNTRHPYPMAVPQSRVEQLLTERLADYGISVRRGHELIALRPDDDGVTATVHDQTTGTDVHLRARYLVACDGGHSTVREDGGYWSTLNPLEGDLYRLAFGPLDATIADQRRDRPIEADEIRHALQAVWGPDTELGDFTWASRFSDATRQVSSTASAECSSPATPPTSTHHLAL